MSKHSMSSEKASRVKRSGHSEEIKFNSLFTNITLNKIGNDINLSGASSDCEIDIGCYIDRLALEFGDLERYSVSLKSGKTWQFHLGKLPELSDIDFYKNSIKRVEVKTDKFETWGKHHRSFNKQKEVLSSKIFWNKYLKKGNLLCYNNKMGDYHFFLMDDVINFIINNFNWRLLDTGRIKGDSSYKGRELKGIITFEFRDESHKSCFVLGAHGAKNGYRLYKILCENLKNICISPEKE